MHLICTNLDGRVRWRAVGEEPLGPFAAGSPGVALLIGQSLGLVQGGLRADALCR